MTTVAEIPVRVAQKRVKASSPCSDAAPQSMSTASGNVPGHPLSVAITQDTGDILRKLIVSYSLFSRFCFWKDRLTGGPGRGFCFQPTFRVQPPLVGRATPQSHQVSGAESCGTTPPLCGNCPSRSFPCGLTFMHVYYWVSRLHVGSYTVIFILGS